MSGRSELPPGVVLNRRYQIVQVLGQGGFGITYCAKDVTNGATYAVKEYFPSNYATRRRDGSVVAKDRRKVEFDRFRAGFVTETEHLSMFDHPNIVPVVSRFIANNTAYFVMEYLTGAVLGDQILRQGPLSGDAVSLIGENLIEAVKTIHDQDLIHRDIKPHNIVLGEVKARRRTRIADLPDDVMTRFGKPILLDFGAARVVGPNGRPMTLIVSEGFGAPEQFDEFANQDKRLDLFGLAATLYYCLSGLMLPSAIDRRAGTPLEPAARRFAGSMPRHRLQAIDRALELDPAKRPANIREFRREFFDL